MDPFAVSHFSNHALKLDLKTRVGNDCKSIAVLLTRIAEFDDRKLYREEGHPSMRAYCLDELHFSEGTTYKRINAARAARRFPAILVAVAEGRVHLSAVVTLAAYLTSANVDELLAAATHKTRAEIELMLAQRFPRPDLPERLQAIPSPVVLPSAPPQLSPGKVDVSTFSTGPSGPGPVQQDAITPSTDQPAAALAGQLAPERVESPAPRSRMMPLAPERYGLQVTLDQETHDLLQQAQALMSHQVPAGEIAPVLKCALRHLVAHLEKRKFAATDRPGPARPTTSARHIPAAVKRTVWERDGGQCTFISDTGHRCQARTRLEFDHQDPVARGGRACAESVRLLCRAHNQHAAERVFGVEFMERKRAER